ncbi:MAG: UDP-N-acetylmuramoyl-L-alanine--D-glutamate ligase, partial [Candidatus Eremiobacteraeota bacterium]|nr:UDP-N-acetylmuramoyl-L-alanine--D-glutamate ligase [Candidatus Eremiobacteraeota bacterium]
SFEPLPHRLTVVRQDRGITWIDDSKATNPDAAVKALEAFNEPIVLIAGGKSKKTDFAQFAKVASQRAKLIILIGEAAAEIAAHLSGAELRFAHSLADAVEMARQAAVPGDVVLLSPACASFDMFANAEQRGEAFAELARSKGDRTGMAAS